MFSHHGSVALICEAGIWNGRAPALSPWRHVIMNVRLVGHGINRSFLLIVATIDAATTIQDGSTPLICFNLYFMNDENSTGHAIIVVSVGNHVVVHAAC